MLKIAKFSFYLFGINTYVVYDTDTREAAVIDPGMTLPEEFEAMEKFISRENLTVTHLINTHLHVDHAIADQWVKRQYNVAVSAHPLEEKLGQMMPQQGEAFGVSGVEGPIEIERHLNDGDIIRIGDGEMQVIHVPGHSPGSIALYCRNEGFAIVGDALFEGSIGRTDLPGGNYRQLIDAITTRLLTLPEATVIYPGHGGSTTVGREKEMNPFLS